MSMRYVRDGSGSQSKPHNTKPWPADQGRGRGRGRGRFSGRGRGRFSHSLVRATQTGNKWVRSSDDAVAGAAASETADKDGLHENVESTDDVTENVESVGSKPEKDNEHISSTTNGEKEASKSSTNSFERRGKNKLVLKKDDQVESAVGDDKNAGVSSSNQSPSTEQVERSEDFGPSHEEGESSDRAQPPAADKVAHENKDEFQCNINEMVTSSSGDQQSKEEVQGSQANASVGHEANQATATQTSLERRGKNKLVLKKDDIVDSKSKGWSNKKDKTSNSTPTRSKSSFAWSRESKRQPAIKTNVSSNKSQNINSDARKRKRQPPFNAPAKGSRRICLNTNEPADEATTSVSPNAESSDGQTNTTTLENLAYVPNKKLTDFAYRDTGRGGGRAKRGSTANMGLVRVKPENPSETAICPTFRRGLPCNNPKCKLRHDVSSEASRPICVFFQRNGMCSKGDACVFRHVKVRWDAEVCPMFERLGYCENPDCVLRHVAAKKSADRKDGSNAKSS